MNKQDIIARIGSDIYTIECEDARAAAPFVGQVDAVYAYTSDTPHQIDTWIWHSDTTLTTNEKIQLLFAIYQDMPCYALLMLNGVRYEHFERETKELFWETVITLLSSEDEALAQPLLYMLWCDFFELCQECEAWHRVVTADAHPRLLHRVLAVSGPIPFHLKEELYRQLISDPSYHMDIYRSLRNSYYDLYGQIDKIKTQELLADLVIPTGSDEYRHFSRALTQGGRYSNQRDDIRQKQALKRR